MSRQKLLQLGWEVLIHLPYSPDIAPSDFHLFRYLQNSLNGKNFSSLEDCKRHLGASLVAQWLKIHLPTQETQVRALVQEDPTCRGATKPVHHNYWAHVPQLLKPTRPRARALQQEKPLQWEARAPHTGCGELCSPQLKKAHAQQQRPKAAKNNLKKKKALGTVLCSKR